MFIMYKSEIMKPDPQERPDFEKFIAGKSKNPIDQVVYQQLDFENAAKEYADNEEKAKHGKESFIAGANHGYDLSRKRIEELETMVNTLKEAMIKGTRLSSTLLFDDQELPEIEIAQKRIEELEAEIKRLNDRLLVMSQTVGNELLKRLEP